MDEKEKQEELERKKRERAEEASKHCNTTI